MPHVYGHRMMNMVPQRPSSKDDPTAPSASCSVMILIDQLRSGGDAERQRAARVIWDRFIDKLISLAREKLSARVQQRVDPEDVVQSVYKSFCLRLRRGEFTELEDRDGLMRLLARMTLNKAANVAARQQRMRRDVRRDHRDPAGSEESRRAIDLVLRTEPTPEEAEMLNEEMRACLAELNDDTLRNVAQWKLEGFTDKEIAGKDRLNCAVRTVERKTERIKKIWAVRWERVNPSNA